MAVAQSTALVSMESITHASYTPADSSSGGSGEVVVRRASRSSSRRDRTPPELAAAAAAAGVPTFLSASEAAAVGPSSPPRRAASRLRTPSVSTIREHEQQQPLPLPQRLIVTPATAASAESAANSQPSKRPPFLTRSPSLPQPSSTPPLSAGAAARAALTGPAVVSPALLLVPRPVRFRLWLFLYSFPLLVWLSASIVVLIAHLARSSSSRQRDGNLYFFRPEAPETSSDWVLVGWVANWVSGVVQIALITAIVRLRSPFFPGITLGSLLSLVVMSIAPIAHSNALIARNVLDPAHDSVHSAVQLEWIALVWSLLLVIGLLLQAPRRIQMPLVIALRSKTNLELRALLRQAQGDLAAAQATMHQRLYGGATAAAVATKDGAAAVAGNLTAVGQTEVGYGLNTLARSQLKDILRSTRGQHAFASMDQPLMPASSAGGSSQPNSARSVSISSSGDEALALPPLHQRAGGSSKRRSHSRRASSLERAATGLALAAVTTDSRDAVAGGKLSKLDRDMQKFSSAVRAASTAAAERQAESFSVESLDAPVPSYMLEPPGSNAAAGAGTGSTRSHRSHKHHRAHSRSKSKGGGHGSNGGTRSHKKRHGHGRSVADSSASISTVPVSNSVDFFTAARDELARPPTIEEQQALQRQVLAEQEREREDREAAASGWV